MSNQEQITSTTRKRVSLARCELTRLRVVLVLVFCTALPTTSVAQESIFDQREQKLVSGLRERALFDLAESHCLKLGAREGLTPTDFASLAIERIRVRTSQARTAQDRSAQWQIVDQIADEFSAAHSKNPRAVLVELQQALAHISFARLLQQEVEARISKPGGREQGLKQLIAARAILDRAKQNGIDTIKAQANQNLSPDMLSSEQLRTLVTRLEYQLAIVNLTSAQLTDASSETEKLNRLDSLGRVPDQLKAVRGSVANSKVLWWNAWIAEATCRRMLGEFSTTERILKSLDNEKRPKSTDVMLLREEIAFAIARNDKDRMKRLAERALKKRHDGETEVALIQLLVASSQIEKASSLANKVSAKHGPWWARRADVALLSGSGAKKTTDNSAVESAGIRLLLEAADKAEKNGDFDAASRGYLSVAESQFSSGERAAGLTTTVRGAMALEKQSKHNEAAAALLKSARANASEELAPSIHLRGCWNLSKAKSEKFETEAKAHVRQWPESESSNQARYWLASQQLAQKDFKLAFKTLLQIGSQSPHFSAAVKLARFAARKQLTALEEKGLATRALATQMLQSWADVYSGNDKPSQLLAAVAMAELGLAWRAEGSRTTYARLESVSQASTADSNFEYQCLLATGRKGKESSSSLAKAFSQPFDAREFTQLLAMLDRVESTKELVNLKLSIADDAIAKSTEAKQKNQFLLSKASALVELGKEAEAQKIFKQLTAADPKNLTVLLGMARVSKGESALKMWRSIASRTKQQTSAWFEAKYNVARLLHESGKSPEASKMLKYIKAVPPGWEDSELKPRFEKLLRESSG